MTHSNNSKNTFSAVAQALPVGILSFDASGSVTFCNENFRSLVAHYSLLPGVLPASERDIDAFELLNSLQASEAIVQLKEGFGYEKELKTIRTSDGGAISVILKCSPAAGHDNSFDGAVLVLEDLKSRQIEELGQNEKPEDENTVRVSREEYFELLELREIQGITSPVSGAVVAADMKGGIVFWNEAASEVFLRKRSEVFGRHISRIIPQFTQEFLTTLETVWSEQGFWQSQIKIPSGPYKNLSLLVKARRLERPSNRLIVFLFTDITELAESLSILKTSEETFRNIALNLAEAVAVFAADGQIRFANPAFCSLFEYDDIPDSGSFNMGDSGSFNIGDAVNMELPLDDFSGHRTLRTSGTSIRTGRQISLEARLSYFPGYSERFIVASFADITSLLQVQEQLELFRFISDSMGDGFAAVKEGVIAFVNRSLLSMLGCRKAEDLTGKDPDVLFGGESEGITRHLQEMEKGIAEGRRFDLTGKKKNGNTVKLCVKTGLFSYGNIRTGILFISDRSEEDRLNAELQNIKEKYNALAGSMDGFFWTADLTVEKINPVFFGHAVEKITGYSSERFRRDSRLWLRVIHPDDTQTVKKKLRALFFDRTRSSDELVCRIISRSGNVAWISIHVTTERDPSGNARKISGIVTDITHKKKAEEELRTSAVALKEMNDTKDKFISIISHDLRTPFSSIIGFSDILLGEKDLTEAQRSQYISFINESSKNMLALVNSLLDWTRLQTGRIKFEPVRLDASLTAGKAISMNMGAAISKDISLELSMDNEMYVHADEGLLLQVFNNLLSNAVKFTNTGGRIVVSAVPVPLKNAVEFSVKDNGTGIKAENLDKLFHIDSKFTLEGTRGEKGSGLGLSLVNDIIRKHGGSISVESRPGEGTEFRFVLPVSSTIIILADSNKTDRLLYGKILRNLAPAYTVEFSGSGSETYTEILEKSPALVITEHYLPGMSGFELVRKVRDAELNVKPPFILLSREINKHIAEEYRELGVEYVFRKPVALGAFKDAIEKSLRKALFRK